LALLEIPVPLELLGQKDLWDSKVLLGVVVIPETEVQLGFKELTDHLVREDPSVYLEIRVDLDSLDLKDLVEMLACLDLRERLDQLVCMQLYICLL